MILADFGIGSLKRVNNNFRYLFPNGYIEYEWENKIYVYHFQTLPVKELSNDLLGISNKKLVQRQPFNELTQDIIVLLFWGSACTDPETAEKLAQCKINACILVSQKLWSEFAKRRYIAT